jgi:hypothetical protein
LLDREDHVKRNTYCNNWYSVNQCQRDKQLGHQHWLKFRLAGNTFKIFSAEDADSNTTTDSSKAHQNATSYKN